MTSALLGKAGKKLFEKHLEQYAPVDPKYEFYVDEHGKQQRRKVCILDFLMDMDAHKLYDRENYRQDCQHAMPRSSRR